VRYWLPLLAALVCLVVATRTSPIVSYVLVIAAFGLVIEVSTKMLEAGTRGGRLTDHRQ
jgi:Mg2+/citrate symporter